MTKLLSVVHFCFRASKGNYSGSVLRKAQTSGTERVWAASGVKDGRPPGPVPVVVVVASSSARYSHSSPMMVPVLSVVKVGDRVVVLDVVGLLKPHIGGSVWPSTSSSISVPIQYPVYVRCSPVELQRSLMMYVVESKEGGGKDKEEGNREPPPLV